MMKQLPYRTNFEPEYQGNYECKAELGLRQMKIPVDAFAYEPDLVKTKAEYAIKTLKET